MQGAFIIRLKALFLSAIFTGNFLVVCHCSAAAAEARPEGVISMHEHCCCQRHNVPPFKGTKSCPGKQAMKFNLLEKKAAAAVRMCPLDAMLVIRYYPVSPVECRMGQRNFTSAHLPPHAPPDRLALFQCYLI